MAGRPSSPTNSPHGPTRAWLRRSGGRRRWQRGEEAGDGLGGSRQAVPAGHLQERRGECGDEDSPARVTVDPPPILAEHADTFAGVIVADLGRTSEQAALEVTATRERLGLVREEVRKIFGEYIRATGWPTASESPPSCCGSRSGPWPPSARSTTRCTHRVKDHPRTGGEEHRRRQGALGGTDTSRAVRSRLRGGGLPAGVLNVITGRGSDIGDLLASHADVSMISFTGSTSVGRSIAAGAGPKPMHLDLGGNAAGIVLADADLDVAIENTVLGAYKNAGQRCDAISRVLVEQSVYDEYVERALKEAERWTVGDPRAETTKVGPLVNEKAATHVHDLVDDAVAKGARLLAGGEVHDAYHEPTVLADVPLDADIVWEETFGPVLTVLPVADLDTAIELANRSR